MDKVSVFFKRIMLGILLLLLALTLGLVVREGVQSRSYLLALVAGAVWAAGAFLLLRRVSVRVPRRAALWLGLGCFVLNLIWVLVIRIEPFSDYFKYWQTACALARGEALPESWYLSLYPHILGTASFLSLFVRLFGESVLAVSLVNVLLTTLSCLLLYRLGSELYGEETGFLAGLLWAVDPCKMMLNSLVFSEPLYTCLILLFFLLVTRLERRIDAGAPLSSLLLRSACLGAVLLFVNLIRPIAAILWIALAIWLLFLRGRALTSAAGWKRRAPALALMLCVYVLGGRLWTGHVEKLLGTEVATTPVYNIYVGFNEETQGQWSAEDMDLLTAYHEQGMSAPEAQAALTPHLRERLASGIDFPRLFANKLFAFLGADQLGGYTYRFTRPELFYKLCMGICNVFYYGVFLAALAGLWRLLKSRALDAGLLPPLFFLGLTLAHMLVEVSDRYHYSLIPILILYAALGFAGQFHSQRSTT